MEKADFYCPYRLVTLNIRSRSQKSDQLYILCHNDTKYIYIYVGQNPSFGSRDS